MHLGLESSLSAASSSHGRRQERCFQTHPVALLLSLNAATKSWGIFPFLFKERFPYYTNWCPHGLEDSLYAMVSFQCVFIPGVRDFSNTFVTCGRSETTSAVLLPLTPRLSGLESEVEDSICGKYGDWGDLASSCDIKPAWIFMHLFHERISLPVRRRYGV